MHHRDQQGQLQQPIWLQAERTQKTATDLATIDDQLLDA